MNIFKILANGNGSVNENNISAFLGYLLDPNANHSLGHAFLERFLEDVITAEEGFNVYNHEYKVFFEQGKSKRVDIVIVCYSGAWSVSKSTSQMSSFLTGKMEIRKIFLIENKINSAALKVGQLKKQFETTFKELKSKGFDMNSASTYSIYTTPDDIKYDKEFNSLVVNDNKIHIYWANIDKGKKTLSIRSILEDLLKDENEAKMDAINTYTKDTIKSFIQFIDNGFKSEIQEEVIKKVDELESVPAYVRRVTKELFTDGLISDEMIEKLKDIEYSKSTFKIYFEFIRQRGMPLNRSENDSRSGYYKTEEIFEDYFITSQWYSRHKESFDKWADELRNKTLKE